MKYEVEDEQDPIKRLIKWKDFVENRGMRVNMNKTKVMLNGERQKITQKAVRWPCSLCGNTHNRFTALWNLSGKTRVSRYQKNIHPLLSS